MLTHKQRIYLASSKEFQQITDSDPELKRINDSKENKGAELFTLAEMFRSVIRLGKVYVQPITPAIWAFLWAIDNSYTKRLQQISPEDTDVFFWVLHHGIRKLECEVEEIVVRCAGAVEEAGMDYEEAAAELLQLIHYTFRPLSFLPPNNSTDDNRIYDTFWLTQICDIAAVESGERASDIMFNMPLSTCFLHYVHQCAKNDRKGLIRRRTPQEINQQIIDRLEQLGEDFCTKYKVR